MGGNQNHFRRRTPILTGLQDGEPVGAGKTQIGNHDLELPGA